MPSEGGKNLDRGISYRFEFPTNTTDVKAANDAQKELTKETKETEKAASTQRDAYLRSTAALMALRSGINGVAGSLEGLGLISEKNNQIFFKTLDVFNMIVGTAQAFKGIAGLVTALTAAETGLASVETYRTVLKSPAMIGAVIGGIALSTGIAGYLIGQANRPAPSAGPVIHQNITFQGGASPDYSSRYASRSAMESTGVY